MALPEIPIRSDSPCLRLGCSRCCEATEMTLTEADVERIEAATGLEWAAFSFRAEDGFLQLRTQDDEKQSCTFLVDHQCSIFEHRPEGCRVYPAIQDDDVILDQEHCPATQDFVLTGQVQAAVKRLAQRLEAEAKAWKAGSGQRP